MTTGAEVEISLALVSAISISSLVLAELKNEPISYQLLLLERESERESESERERERDVTMQK